MTFKGHSRSSAIRSPGLSITDRKSRLHLFSDKNTWKLLEGHSRLLVMAQFNRPHITFHWLSVVPVTVCLPCIISEIFNTEQWQALEIWVMGHSRSLKMALFDRSYSTFYESAIASTAILYNFWDIWRWRILWP